MIPLPKKICHHFGWHRWVWPVHSRAFIAGKCVRCGMNGVEFWKLQKAERDKQLQKEKST